MWEKHFGFITVGTPLAQMSGGGGGSGGDILTTLPKALKLKGSMR